MLLCPIRCKGGVIAYVCTFFKLCVLPIPIRLTNIIIERLICSLRLGKFVTKFLTTNAEYIELCQHFLFKQE